MPATHSDLHEASRYSRSRGAVCFELPLLGPLGRPPTDLVEQLLASNLEWLWISETRPPSPDQRGDVATRALTHLTESTSRSLIAELSERDEDGYGRFLALFGVRKLPHRLEPTWLHEGLRKLAAEQDGGVELAVVQIGDTPNDYVYVRRDPSDGAAQLLDEWNIGEASSFEEKKYRALGVATLEHLFGLDDALGKDGAGSRNPLP